jgi:starvation-inducible DNA-binding protein
VADSLASTVAKQSTLPAFSLSAKDGRAIVEMMVQSLAAACRVFRAAINQAAELGDADTADLFTAVSRSLDKSLWMVEAHLHAER